MKKLYSVIFFIICLPTSELNAAKILVNTSNSFFEYLRVDSCSYDTQINTVSCKDHGTFQNVKKQAHEPQGIQDQLIGTIVGTDGKTYDLFAMTPQQAINHAEDLLATIKATAEVLFNPVEHIDEKTIKPNPYAVTSKNEAAVEALFGVKGLNTDTKFTKLKNYFKNFYFYFEYVVKVEFAARIADYAHQNGIDFRTTLATKTWQDLITLVEGKAGGWSALEKKLFDASINPDWNAIQGLIKASSWQDLTTTSFWTSLNNISTQSLMNSSFWQKYVKYTISRSFVQDQQLLLSIKQVEQTIFKYIPNIEVAYYTPDFTSLRNASEMFHMSLILTDALRNRYIPQCNDWKLINDIAKVYSAALEYQKTPFYSIASYALDDQAAVYSSVAQNKDAIKVPLNDDKFKQEPLLQEELLLLSMIKILHALTNYLYDSDHLETTMDVLANKSIIQPKPSIFLYAPEDYLYLEDINLLHDSFKQNVITPKMPMAMGPGASKKDTAKSLLDAVLQHQKKIENPQVKVQSFFGDLWDDVTKKVVDWAGDVEEAGEKVWSDIKKTGKDFIDFATDAGKAIAEEAEALGFGTASVFLSGINPDLAKHLLDNAKNLQKEVADHVENAKNELENTVNDVENVAKDSLSVLGTVMEGVCDITTDNKDTEICKSLRGAFESAFDLVITEIAGDLKTFVAFGGGMVKLSVDGISLISNVAADIATHDYADLSSDLVDGLKQFGADAAVAILEPLSIQFQYFMKMLGDALRFCQYFISVITRIFIDVTTAITYAIGATIGNFANLFGANINPSEWAKAVDTALTEHERLIGTAITTGLLLATIPLTGGASIPLIAMTVGPQIFAAYGSWQADEEANKQKQEEKDFVESFSSFVSTNALIYQQQQNEWTNELQLKYTSELENKERNLGFYENLLANNFESLKEQYAEALGSYWMQLLSPDASYFNLIPADVGALYGFTTGVYELNPSQGFSLYSAARQSFSQEIAVMPALALPTDEKIVKKVETKNWFNQKEVMILDKPVNEVEIRFQAIYLLNTFYIGLYFGGQDINLSDIKNTKKAPLDLGKLAKTAVFKKEDSQSSVTFGVYEHEGKGTGWLTQSADAPKFKLGTWYRIKMNLQGTSLQVKVWQESDPEPSGSLMLKCSAPSPSQRIVGVISSGASIEYQFVPQISPKEPINQKIRPKGKRCTIPCDFTQFVDLQKEVEREQEARQILNYLMNPTIKGDDGKITELNAVGKMQILRQQYIYTTDKTKLSLDGKIVDDYVVPSKAEFFQTVDIVDESIGGRPEETSYLVSLISESLFDNNLQYADYKASDIFATYTTSKGPLSTALEQKITDLRKKYFSQENSLTIGAFTLQVNKDALQKQKYLYMAPMKDAKGPIKDLKGQPIQDYFLLTVLDSNKQGYKPKTAGNPGISYSDMLLHDRDSIGITSLVSGNLYGSKDLTPLRNYRTDYLWQHFDTDAVLPEIQKAIAQSQSAYQAVSQPSGSPIDTPDNTSSTKKTTGKDISSKTDTGKTSGKSLPIDKPADKSAQQQADNASGGSDNYSFGGPT